MILRILIVVVLLWNYASAYNVETTQTYSMNLRDGGKTLGKNSEIEPTYAGYTFDVKKENDIASILVGQPRSGEANKYLSPGAIFYCNFSYVGDSTTSILTTVGLSTMSETSGVMATASMTTTEDISTTPTSSEGTTTVASRNTSVSTIYMNATDSVSTAEIASTTAAALPDFSLPECEKLEILNQGGKLQKGQDHKIDADALGLSMGKLAGKDEYAVCSILRQRKCPETGFTPGACYIGNPRNNNWKLKNWNETACFDEVIEIIFVVDGSGSIGEDNFAVVKQWLINVISDLMNEFGDAVRTQVLQFSSKDRDWDNIPIEKSERFVIPYTLSEKINISEIKQRINNMKYLGASTYTFFALTRTMKFEFPKSEFYNVSKKVVVVLTDGEANDGVYLDDWHNDYKDVATTFAVGVGKYMEFLSQLQTIANGGVSMENVLTVNDFDALQSVISNLTSVIKNQVIEGGGSTNSSDGGISKDVSSPQIGSSIASNVNGSVYFGGVGMYQGTGTIMKYDSSDNTEDYPHVLSFLDIENFLPDAKNDTPYMGYSTVTGYFDGYNSFEHVATGAPRDNLNGSVIVYKSLPGSAEMDNAVIIYAPSEKRQIGSYFGGVLLSVDVNGDNKDDLFIGAPLYVGERQNYDEGRVFAYISQSNDSLTSSLLIWNSTDYNPIELYGANLARGRFGTAMANAGDLNLDGFNDVIIGAPLAEDGRGAVFVYHGGKDGIQAKYSQKILASSLTDNNIQYFGQSMQGNIDIDDNHYPDIFIGAPKSDSVVILRTRPIVSFFVTMEFRQTNLSIFDCINNDYKNCSSVEICFLANGTAVESNLDMQYILELDTDKLTEDKKRIEIPSSEGDSGRGVTAVTKNITLLKEKTQCYVHSVDMRKNVDDYGAAIIASITYDLLPSHVSTPMSSLRDPLQENKNHATISFEKQCGKEDECVHDLQVDASIKIPSFTMNLGDETVDYSENGKILIINPISSVHPATVSVNFTNVGENAFGTRLNITYSSNVDLSTTFDQKSYPTFATCAVEEGVPINHGNGLKTQIFRYDSKENIMQTDEWCFFKVNVLTDDLKTSGAIDLFTVNVTVFGNSSSSNENNTSDNSWGISPEVKYRSDFTIRKESSHQDISFNYTTETKNITSIEQISPGIPQVLMAFRITGAGYSNIPSSQLSLSWPSIYAGTPLLYLYDLQCNPEFAAGIDNPTTCTCDRSNVNNFKLTVVEDPNDNSTKNQILITPPEAPFNVSEIDCRDLNSATQACQTLKCNVTNLGESDQIYFIAKFRLWTSTITFEGTNQTQLDLQSAFEISTVGSPLVIDNKGSNVTIKKEEIATIVKKYVAPEIVEKQNDLFYYIAGIAGGIVLLIVIILILWKLGFFNSKYADMKKTEQERLEDETDFPDIDAGEEFTMGANGNGYHGDGSFTGSPEPQYHNFIDTTIPELPLDDAYDLPGPAPLGPD